MTQPTPSRYSEPRGPVQGASPHHGEGHAITLGEYWDIVWRRKMIIIVMGALFFLCAYAWVEPDSLDYRAGLSFKVSPPDIPGARPSRMFATDATVGGMMQILNLDEVRRLTAERVSAEMWQLARAHGPQHEWPEFALPRDGVFTLARAVRVEVNPDDRAIFDVRVTTRDKVMTQVVLTTLRDAYLDYLDRYREARLARYEQSLQSSLDQLKQETIALTRAHWTDLQRARIDADEVGMDELSETFKTLDQSRLQRQANQMRLAEIRQQLTSAKVEVPRMENFSSQRIDTLRRELVQLETDRALLLTRFTAEHPEVVELSEQIEDTQMVYMQEQESLFRQGLLKPDVYDVYRGLQQEALELQISIGSAERRETVLREVVQGYVSELDQMSDKQLEMERRQMQIRENQERFQNYVRLLDELDLARKMESGQVDPIGGRDQVLTANAVGIPLRWNKITALTMIGLVLGVFMAWLLDLSDTRIKGVTDLRRFFTLPILGEIPHYGLNEMDVIDDVISHYEAGSPLSEPFRVLRTRVEFKSIDQPMRTLMIASAGQSEGKTTVVTNLGIAMAQRGKRVLLVDCDMRKPALNKRFSMDRKPGLAEVLAQGKPWRQVIRETPVPGLFILPSGQPPTNPSELLGSERMSRLLAELSEQFDAVLIDIAAIRAVTDAAVMASMVDGVLLTVAMMRVRREVIAEAIEIMENVGAHLLGAVVNDSRGRGSAYYGYSRYGYHRGYGYGYSEDAEEEEQETVGAGR